jgi:hypothetical protein
MIISSRNKRAYIFRCKQKKFKEEFGRVILRAKKKKLQNFESWVGPRFATYDPATFDPLSLPHVLPFCIPSCSGAQHSAD